MTRPLILLVALCALAACEREPVETAQTPPPPPATSVWTSAAAEADLTTFTNALQVAGVEPTLRSSGPYTVFAPTNAAFALMPVTEREPLLQPEHLTDLRTLLIYHIVSGRLTAADLAQRATQAGGQFELTTMQGDVLKVAFTDGRLSIIDGVGHTAVILEPDQTAPNGVIHAVDSVLRRQAPPPQP
jgi:uncharacterized surface protein with fasciclin (FAS1) repeats